MTSKLTLTYQNKPIMTLFKKIDTIMNDLKEDNVISERTARLISKKINICLDNYLDNSNVRSTIKSLETKNKRLNDKVLTLKKQVKSLKEIEEKYYHQLILKEELSESDVSDISENSENSDSDNSDSTYEPSSGSESESSDDQKVDPNLLMKVIKIQNKYIEQEKKITNEICNELTNFVIKVDENKENNSTSTFTTFTSFIKHLLIIVYSFILAYYIISLYDITMNYYKTGLLQMYYEDTIQLFKNYNYKIPEFSNTISTLSFQNLTENYNALIQHIITNMFYCELNKSYIKNFTNNLYSNLTSNLTTNLTRNFSFENCVTKMESIKGLL